MSLFVEWIIEIIHDLQELAQEYLTATKLKSKNYYDKKISSQVFQINDQVFFFKWA